MILIEPSKENIEDHFDKLKNPSTNNTYLRTVDIISMAVNTYSENNKEAHVLAKAILINKLYNTNIISIDKVANHIVEKNVHQSINTGKTQAVKEITSGHGVISKKKGSEYKFYSFATKYCFSHNPESFPIYDRNIDTALCEYKKMSINKEKKFINFKKSELKDYDTFIRVLSDFKSDFYLEDLPNDYIDKFLWSQGDAFLKNKKNKTLSMK
ncbi:hypothetical protein [Ferruginibacter sp.]